MQFNVLYYEANQQTLFLFIFIEKYQLDMMKSLRQVNVDHYHVGWYQSSDVGNFLSLPLLESQFHYQTSIEESVVLIFG